MKKLFNHRWLFRAFNVIAGIIFGLGVLSFFYIFLVQQDLYEALGIFIAFSWTSIFIWYFSWATYFYNVNYGWTDRDWVNWEEALEKKKQGEYVTKEELEAPQFNPYRSQSFGLPTGTVRGMITFTLLFGAISLMISSFGKDGNISQDSFYWDHFEFFKTAFLMMIAFYFGDKSLKYLSNRSNAAREKNWLKYKQESGVPTSQLDEDDLEFQAQMGTTEVKAFDGSPASPPADLSALKKAIANSENDSIGSGMFPVIDAGHGGVDPKTKEYTTGNAKRHHFTDAEGNPSYEILEGVINRGIAQKLIDLLKQFNIPYLENTVYTHQDVSLKDRVRFANEEYATNKNVYFLSIHSNAVATASPGPGEPKARGFEIFTSVGQTKSDHLADIAAKWYKKDFPDFKFRQDMVDGDADKEADYYVLRKTACPAFLVENLFFTNETEAQFLLSEAGQMRIATCLFKTVKEIYETQSNGILG